MHMYVVRLHSAVRLHQCAPHRCSHSNAVFVLCNGRVVAHICRGHFRGQFLRFPLSAGGGRTARRWRRRRPRRQIDYKLDMQKCVFGRPGRVENSITSEFDIVKSEGAAVLTVPHIRNALVTVP